jgi:hypothetical protein
MRKYESTFFGLRMQIPEGWTTQICPDDGMADFSRDAATWKPEDSTSICFHATRTLVSTRLEAPGSANSTDAGIEFQACVQTDEYFVGPHHGEPLKKMNLNGIQVLYFDDLNEGSPENVYYRFPRWKFSTGLWLYARIMACGKARFDCALSVFATLAPLASPPHARKKPMFEREPWNVAPSLFRMAKVLNENDQLYDLAFESEVSEEALTTNCKILSGRQGASATNWTPLHLRRKSRVRNSDCYYGPQSVYSSGIYSSRAIELLRPYLMRGFSLLPCTVNGKPHYFFSFKGTGTCLDAENSQISRFLTEGS